jgi:hypothetical protein
MPAQKRTPAQVYQLKITLQGTKPPIWRRVQVPGNVTLAQLHDTVQAVMGWTDSHLHQFIIGDECYGPHDPDLDMDLDMADERKVKLSQVASLKDKFVYQYDFGDCWEHLILVEKLLPPEPEVRYPACVDGQRNCPPEDCGGAWGYQSLLKTIADPTHPDHEEMCEWLGDEFDAEVFDVATINSQLHS